MKLYIFNGIEYVSIGQLPFANSKEAGIMKLYDSLGENVDGTMTQRAITEELEKKVGASISGETIIFK